MSQIGFSSDIDSDILNLNDPKHFFLYFKNGSLRKKVFCCIFQRERKREREREDLWRKLDDLSLNNAKKEGISLDLVNPAEFHSSSSR